MSLIKKLITYSLYLLVFLLPWQTRWIIRAGELNGGYFEYGTISLYGTDIFLIFLLIFFIVYKINNNRNPKSEIRNPKQILTAKPPQMRGPAKSGEDPVCGKNSNNQVSSFKFQVSSFWYLIAALDLVIFISIFFAPDKVLALYKYGVFLLGIGLFWLLTAAVYDKLKLIYSFLAGVSLQAAFGIWQFLSQSTFASKWLGLAAHDAAALGTSVIEVYPAGALPERWLRAYGGLDHPNMLGGLLVAGILLLIWLMINNSETETKIYDLRFKIYEKVIFYFLFFIFLTVLFFTFSRGAWAGLIAGIAVMLTGGLWAETRFLKGQNGTSLKPSFWKRMGRNSKLGFGAFLKPSFWKAKKEWLMLLLKIIGFGSILTLVLFFSYRDLVLTRLSSDTRLEQKSNRERIESYQTAWELIKESPIIGVGIGNYAFALREWKSAEFSAKQLWIPASAGMTKEEAAASLSAWSYQPVHNTILLVWAEIGVFGALFFIAILIYPLWINMEKMKKSIHKERKGVPDFIFLSIILSILIMMMVDHWWWSLHFGILFFWLILGLSINNRAEERN